MIENVINNPRVPKAGTIWAWGSSSIPYGWLLCDGSAVSRTNYKALFGAIGTTYGTGDGTTTFNLPNGKIAVANSIQCKGNGITLGLTNGTSYAGAYGGNASYLNVGQNAYGKSVGASGISGSNIPNNNGVGITTDSTKSGIVADQSNQTRAIIKY